MHSTQNTYARVDLRVLSAVDGTGFSSLKHQSSKSSKGKNTKNTLLHKKPMMVTKNPTQASR